LAAQTGLSLLAAALGIIEVANTNIDRALRRVSVARGHDPRDFTLVAFGGAGPLHACEVAARLKIPRLLIPRHPGVLCAWGLLMADVVLERSRSVLTLIAEGIGGDLWPQLQAMVARAREDLAREGIAPEDMAFQGSVDARYRGQSYELTIPLAGSSTQDLLSAFHAAYEASYGHAMPEREVEVVHLRLQAIGLVAKPALEVEHPVESGGCEAHLGRKEVTCGQGVCPVDLYDRSRLRPGATFAGPALVYQMDSTVYVAPGWSARVDGYHNIVLEQGQ
jgi:N-methylhydantoinase A